jgi:hypothetical protein
MVKLYLHSPCPHSALPYLASVVYGRATRQRRTHASYVTERLSAIFAVVPTIVAQ